MGRTQHTKKKSKIKNHVPYFFFIASLFFLTFSYITYIFLRSILMIVCTFRIYNIIFNYNFAFFVVFFYFHPSAHSESVIFGNI